MSARAVVPWLTQLGLIQNGTGADGGGDLLFERLKRLEDVVNMVAAGASDTWLVVASGGVA